MSSPLTLGTAGHIDHGKTALIRALTGTDTDRLPELSNLPREIIVIGAGVIGLEYAPMFAALETRVTLIDQHSQILEFVDREIVEAKFQEVGLI